MPTSGRTSCEIRISLAKSEDLEILVALYQLMLEEQQTARGGRLWSLYELRDDPVSDSIQKSIVSDREWIWIGALDGVPFGFASLELVQLRNGEILGLMRELFVESEARAVGLGEALMDVVEQTCMEQGCTGVDAAVLPGNRASKNFMESRGLKARLIRVHREF